ncbi:MAG: hypothetical protein JXR37_05420 [Kiritimatiellae bacterium]|nr:hypothetical protein [Kiritimatiellia bacterium]
MKWYVKRTDGSVSDPVEVDEICRWATAGTIKSGDEVSTDGEIWIQAVDLPDVAETLHGASVPGVNPPRGVPGRSEPEPAPEEAPDAAFLEAANADAWTIRKEITKWRSLYEKGQARWTKENEDLQHQLRDLRREGAANMAELEQMRLDLKRVRGNYEELRQAVREEPDDLRRQILQMKEQELTLQNAYEALERSYDVLFRQLALREKEQAAILALRDEAERAAQERVRELEERLAKERELADDARQRVAALEREFEQVARTCREMNQHLVELRG